MALTTEEIWGMLALANSHAPQRTRIPRVPMIRPELHGLVWQVYAVCRYRNGSVGRLKLRNIKATDPASPVGRILHCSSSHNNDVLRLRFHVLEILGLPHWKR